MKTDFVKQGRRNRERGNEFMREVAILFRRWFPDARRGFQSTDKDNCPDVIKTPFYVECKRSKKPYSQNALCKFYGIAYNKMALWRDEDGNPDMPVMVITRVDKQKPIVWATSSLLIDLGYWEYQQLESRGKLLIVSKIDWKTFRNCLDVTYPIKEVA